VGVERAVEILVVDDRLAQRRALSTVVADLGAKVVEAESGREALRLLLQRDFAVILLDVNMPGMDGFETAALIRQRGRSEQTPIIFVTAFGDETHASRGYQLGAVDYIQTPVDPQALRSKVTVLVELHRKTEEATRHAESLRRQAAQLRQLADLSLAVHGARTLDELLELVSAATVEIVEADEVAVELVVEGAPALGPGAAAGRHLVRRPADTALGALPLTALGNGNAQRVRLTEAQLAVHPTWSSLEKASGRPRLRGWLGVPLLARDGRVVGALHLSGKRGGEFSAEDETVLVQVAQIASIAAENTVFKDAQEANRLKDQFLATLSHELRTPLQALLSWSTMLRQDASDGALLARGLEVIERSARTQKQLIDDLLDVSRIMTGKLALELEPVSLRQVTEAAVDAARPAAEAKRVRIGVSLGTETPTVDGDALRLQQVVGNLLSNGIKFTPAGGEVQVVMLCDRAQAELMVIDSGEGIAPELLPHVFERFRQGDSSSTRYHAGLGIGLAIVRHLVELHGGNVRAESQGLGKGTTFVVTLPLASPREWQLAEPAVVPAPVRSHSALAGVRLLLVEDADETRECLALILAKHGAQVTAVASVAEALAALEGATPDVLVSDIAMSGRDGFELIEEVRVRSAELGRIPAAALTAYARPEEAARALRAGFDVHLSKPVQEETLVSSVLALAAGRPGAN
jgi:signal transduction histidine kinase/DNA-binding response OmpR family regulator